ncbi:hypothetical protein EDD15DRAFT_2197823 [Pisolithus albus]|nr:hypothetical protein EDD15DRAFT_2197823 [Pisolithus albus]
MLLPFFSTLSPSLLLLLLLGFTAITHVHLRNYGCYIVGVSWKLFRSYWDCFFTSIAKKNKLLMVASLQSSNVNNGCENLVLHCCTFTSRFLWVKTLLREEIGTGAMDHVLDKGNEQIVNHSRQANAKLSLYLPSAEMR